MDDLIERPKFITDLKPGDHLIAFSVVRKLELRTKQNGQPYLMLELGDRTGRITAMLWDDAQSVSEKIAEGSIVKVKGTVSSYKDRLQLTLDRIRGALPEDHVDPTTFIPRGKQDSEALMTHLKETISEIQNVALRRLLDVFFGDADRLNRFCDAPGGKLWHHAYIGGLLEHTMALVEICKTMSTLYPDVHKDLLITGALLHDIGKLDEYGFESGYIDFTEEGRLWGHISIGAQHVRDAIEELEKSQAGFPDELKKQVIHLILSHQGKLEHGSPVLPMTLEAMILFYADEMDSKANALAHIMERDGGQGKTWSRFIQLLDRFIYLRRPDSESTREEPKLFS